MLADDPTRVVAGTILLALAGLGVLLVLLWWHLPNPRRGFTPPPVGSPGHRYRCYCYSKPVTVVVLASIEDERKFAVRGRRQRRHARRAHRPWCRIRRLTPRRHEEGSGTGPERPPRWSP